MKKGILSSFIYVQTLDFMYQRKVLLAWFFYKKKKKKAYINVYISLTKHRNLTPGRFPPFALFQDLKI